MKNTENKYRAMLFIDGDNISYKDMTNIQQFNEDDKIMFFFDTSHKSTYETEKYQKIRKSCKAQEESIISPDGKNSTDFAIVSELSVALDHRMAEYFYIISNDGGFNAICRSLNYKYANQFAAIEKKTNIQDAIFDMELFEAKTESELKNALKKFIGKNRTDIAFRNILEVVAYGLGR